MSARILASPKPRPPASSARPNRGRTPAGPARSKLPRNGEKQQSGIRKIDGVLGLQATSLTNQSKFTVKRIPSTKFRIASWFIVT